MAKSNETYTEKEQERIDAVNRYQKGERPSKICKCLGRSRVWFIGVRLRPNTTIDIFICSEHNHVY